MIAHRPRSEMRPLGYSFPTLLADIRQCSLTPNSSFLDEFGERRLTKYTRHSTTKPPRAGLGRFLPLANVKVLPIAATTGIACMASHLCPEVNGRVTKSRQLRKSLCG
jgi:hypothetical protein